MTKKTCPSISSARWIGHDVRMRQRAGGARLAQKALAHDWVGGEVRRQRLDRDEPVELDVAREVDDAHAAAADLALELVLAGERVGEAQ